jgi:hypothetical protein
MSSTIRIKRTTTSNRPATLANAEIAYIEGSNILVYGTGTGGAGGSATSIIDIGGIGAFLGLANTLNQTALGTYTFSGSVTFSGTTNIGAATATTPNSGDNSTNVATTAYVQAALSGISLTGYATETYVNNAVAALVDAAPAALDTLNELAAALGDDANFATTISTSLGGKLTTANNLSELTATASTARTNLGLGSIATQAADNVSITGGSISGVTIDGGTYS